MYPVCCSFLVFKGQQEGDMVFHQLPGGRPKYLGQVVGFTVWDLVDTRCGADRYAYWIDAIILVCPD